MQTKHLLPLLLALGNIMLFGCENDKISESRINPDVHRAKELVYINKLEEAERKLSRIDTVVLDDLNKGAYYLASAFLYHELGNRTMALSSMSKASEMISSTDNSILKAELSLINGFIFEQLILRSEALKSYFQAYEFFIDSPYTDKLFYTLLGIARTLSNSNDYLELAENLLEKLNSNRFFVLYLNAQAAILSDVEQRNKIMLKSLDYFDEYYALKKQISIYSGIALNYQLLDKIDSSYYYLSAARKIINDHQLSPERNFHFYLIEAYIEAKNQNYDMALETLDILFHHASNEPGILSLAFLRRSIIMKYKGEFSEAYNDLKKHSRLKDEEQAKAEKYQLGLLSIQYKVQKKELELAKIRFNWMITIVLALSTFTILWLLFWVSRKKLSEKKKAIELKYEKTHKFLSEQIEESIKEEQIKHRTMTVEIKDKLDSELKWQEFGALFRVHHPLFREKLLNIHPELTVNDQKHCDCVMARMTVFQTTKILGVSGGAVKKARKKLRNHFGVESTKDLSQYLQNIAD